MIPDWFSWGWFFVGAAFVLIFLGVPAKYDPAIRLKEWLGQKPGERAAQGTPADEQSGETSPSPSISDEWDGLDCSCGGGWKVGHRAGCPEANDSEPVRMCVNCGRTRPESEGREMPGKDCPSPDACTWDMTPDEAWQYWRKKYHDLRDAHPSPPISDEAVERLCREINRRSSWTANPSVIRDALDAAFPVVKGKSPK